MKVLIMALFITAKTRNSSDVHQEGEDKQRCSFNEILLSNRKGQAKKKCKNMTDFKNLILNIKTCT